MTHDEQYMAPPPLAFMNERVVPEFRHKVMYEFYNGWPLEGYRSCQSIAGFLEHVGYLHLLLWLYYVLPAFTVPLLTIPCIWRSRPMRYVLAALGLEMVALACVVWRFPTYAAPAGALLILVVVQGMRRLAVCRIYGKFTGKFLVSSIVVIQLLSFGLQLWLHYAKERGWTRTIGILAAKKCATN